MSPSELASLKETEEDALKFIRKKIENNEDEIGGIFLEPISVSEELFVFRPEFLKRLRQLANELNVPIFIDEIFTGGGRTGKFWAFEHYGDEFYPDLLTFGKGLVLSGVISIGVSQTWNWPSANRIDKNIPERVLDNTSAANPLALIQAIQVMKTIKERELTKNAEHVGEYFVKELQKRAKDPVMKEDIRGVGLLLYVGPNGESLLNTSVSNYQGRWTPPLTLTIENVNEILIQE